MAIDMIERHSRVWVGMGVGIAPSSTGGVWFPSGVAGTTD